MNDLQYLLTEKTLEYIRNINPIFLFFKPSVSRYHKFITDMNNCKNDVDVIKVVHKLPDGDFQREIDQVVAYKYGITESYIQHQIRLTVDYYPGGVDARRVRRGIIYNVILAQLNIQQAQEWWQLRATFN